MRFLLAVALAVPVLPLKSQDRNAIDTLLDRIVQHEQEFLRTQEVEEALVEGLTHPRLHPQRRRDCLDHRLRITDRCEFAQPCAVAVTEPVPAFDTYPGVVSDTIACVTWSTDAPGEPASVRAATPAT